MRDSLLSFMDIYFTIKWLSIRLSIKEYRQLLEIIPLFSLHKYIHFYLGELNPFPDAKL